MSAATEPAPVLTPYGGREVLGTKVSIRNAGDGLSDGMAIDPVELPIGSEVYVVMQCQVAGHQHAPVKDTNGLQLEQILKAGTAAIVDRDLVGDVLEAQATRLEEAKRARELAAEAAKGVRRLLTDDEVEALQAEHDAGDHDGDLGLREGCPGCDERLAEQDALAAAEAGDNVAPIGGAKGGRKRAR